MGAVLSFENLLQYVHFESAFAGVTHMMHDENKRSAYHRLNSLDTCVRLLLTSKTGSLLPWDQIYPSILSCRYTRQADLSDLLSAGNE